MKKDRKTIEVIIKSGFITHSIERLKKKTLRRVNTERVEREGVSVREKTTLLTVIELEKTMGR